MNAALAHDTLAAFISAPSFPCLGAKGALRQGGCRVGLYGSLGSAAETERFADDLRDFSKSLEGNTKGLTAFAAMFPERPPETDLEFETSMWKVLQSLHELDAKMDSWARDVSSDPADPDFSFSFAGRAFFIIGLHPASSRMARQFEIPTLVFNPRSQFTQLREDGRFDPLKRATRQRDIALQGDLNPNLADFGESSEARQYSGRKVEDDWTCPFHKTAP